MENFIPYKGIILIELLKLWHNLVLFCLRYTPQGGHVQFEHESVEFFSSLVFLLHLA